MAARRLAILVMTLIAISMAITVISQPLREQRTREQTTTTSATEGPVPPRKPPNNSTRSEGANRQNPGEQVVVINLRTSPVVRAEVGAPVVLVVRSPRPAQVSIPALGLSGFAERYSPARFPLLPRRPGRFRIEAAPGGVAGTLLVTSPGRGKSP